MNRDVVISGLGVLGPAGIGREALGAVLAEGGAPSAPIDRAAGLHRENLPAEAGLFPELSLATWVPPAIARRMCRPSRFAVAAARLAVEDARLEPAVLEGPRTGVAVGTAFGPTLFTEKLLREILESGPETASPFWFTECVANAPAAEIALVLKARGPNLTITQREAAGLLAVGQAAVEVDEGRSDTAIAGSVEEMTPMLHAILARFGAVARRGGDGAVARPFDRARSGYLPSEGAAMVVLERAERVRGRGGRVLARIAMRGSGFDATAPTAGWGTGGGTLARRARRDLDRAGIPVEAIDAIVSGASGSIAGDRCEAGFLRALWGSRPLPTVLAPKASTGEYGGGFLAAAVLAMRGARFGRTAGFREVDPELGVVPHDGSPLPELRRVLVTSMAAGGAAAWMVLEAA